MTDVSTPDAGTPAVSVKGLSILRLLSRAFPKEGSVTAKSVEVADLRTVICSGVAKSWTALIATEGRLSALTNQVYDLKLSRGSGQPPTINFTLTFTCNPEVGNAN